MRIRTFENNAELTIKIPQKLETWSTINLSLFDEAKIVLTIVNSLRE